MELGLSLENTVGELDGPWEALGKSLGAVEGERLGSTEGVLENASLRTLLTIAVWRTEASLSVMYAVASAPSASTSIFSMTSLRTCRSPSNAAGSKPRCRRGEPALLFDVVSPLRRCGRFASSSSRSSSPLKTSSTWCSLRVLLAWSPVMIDNQQMYVRQAKVLGKSDSENAPTFAATAF